MTLLGFEAAKPRRAADSEATQVPMRVGDRIRRNPSTDQKKVRRAQVRKNASEDLVYREVHIASEINDSFEVEAGFQDHINAGEDEFGMKFSPSGHGQSNTTNYWEKGDPNFSDKARSKTQHDWEGRGLNHDEAGSMANSGFVMPQTSGKPSWVTGSLRTLADFPPKKDDSDDKKPEDKKDDSGGDSKPPWLKGDDDSGDSASDSADPAGPGDGADLQAPGGGDDAQVQAQVQQIAQQLAQQGLTGAVGDPLPADIDPAVHQWINDNLDAFTQMVQAAGGAVNQQQQPVPNPGQASQLKQQQLPVQNGSSVVTPMASKYKSDDDDDGSDWEHAGPKENHKGDKTLSPNNREGDPYKKKSSADIWTTCLTCGGPANHLGQLGGKMWYRCEDCGQEFASNKDKKASMQQREQEILTSLASSTSLDEQYALHDELQTLRQARRYEVEAARELDLADTAIGESMIPVRVHEMLRTADTDWLLEPGNTVTADKVVQDMTTEASLWYGRVHVAVRQDQEEYMEQAKGMASRLAGAYGDDYYVALDAFVRHAEHLAAPSWVNGEDEADDWRGGHKPASFHETGEPPWDTGTGERDTMGSYGKIPDSSGHYATSMEPGGGGKIDQEQSGEAATQFNQDTLGLELEPQDNFVEPKKDNAAEVGSGRAPNVTGSKESFVQHAPDTGDENLKYRWQARDSGYDHGMRGLSPRDPQDEDYMTGHALGIAHRHQHGKAAIKTAADGHEPDQSGHADSSQPSVTPSTDQNPAFPWDMGEAPGMVKDTGSQPIGSGASDVGEVPTPGQNVADYPQPNASQDDNIEPVDPWPGLESEKVSAFRARVQATLASHHKMSAEGMNLHNYIEGMIQTTGANMMERRHFEHIADSISSAPVDEETRTKLAHHFADRLGSTNGMFKRDKFIERATSKASERR